VKVARDTPKKSDKQVLLSLSNELRVLRHVRHPNMVLFHGATVNPSTGAICLVLERVHGLEIGEFLRTAVGPDAMSIRLQVITDVCCALWYLHAQRPQVVHGDLKGSNLLIEQRSTGPHGKLLDFGLSRLMTRDVRPLGGTLTWMAPEVINNPRATPKASADIFSLGRLAHFIITGTKPLVRISPKRITDMAKSGQVPPLDWPSTLPISEKGIAICERCLIVTARHRPTIEEFHADIIGWNALVSKKILKPSDSKQSTSTSSRSYQRKTSTAKIGQDLLLARGGGRAEPHHPVIAHVPSAGKHGEREDTGTGSSSGMRRKKATDASSNSPDLAHPGQKEEGPKHLRVQRVLSL